jgi:hypothetical protein
MKKSLFHSFALFISMTLVGVSFVSCDNMIETPPPNELLVDDAIKTTDDLQRLLNSSYNEVANTFGGFSQMMSEMQSDNLSNPNNNDLRELYSHNVLFFNGTVGGYYSILYRAVFRANFVQDNMDKVSDLSAADKERITGEIKFIRGLCHFTAVRMFAHPYGYTAGNVHPGIAIVKTASTKPSPRLSVAEAYDAILNDLKDAETALPESNGDYADKMSAKALLAQVYFQMGKYTDAASYAGAVIDSKKYTLSDTVNLFASESSSEHIFKIVSTGVNDKRSGAFSDYYAPGNPTGQLSRELWANLNVDLAIDKRLKLLTVVNAGAQNEFVKSEMFNAPFFNVPVLHLTQMHLIRAEALAKSGGDLTTATADINAIIQRAYTDNSKIVPAGSTAQQIITATRAQRRIELLFQGDRTPEIKRLGAVETENIFVRGHRWDCPGFLLQFPITEKTTIFEINPTGGCN